MPAHGTTVVIKKMVGVVHVYQQIYDPVAGSLGWTSIFAVIPLTLMFVMLGVLKRSPQLSALTSLVVCLAVAVLVYSMPLGVALNSGGPAFSVGSLQSYASMPTTTMW